MTGWCLVVRRRAQTKRLCRSEKLIGKTIWIFDENRRHYRKDENGRSLGSPIWREHWVAYEVIDETPRSWILRHSHRKVPKKGGYGIAFSIKEIDRLEFITVHRRKIADKVISLDYDKLKQVADLIGYKGE